MAPFKNYLEAIAFALLILCVNLTYASTDIVPQTNSSALAVYTPDISPPIAEAPDIPVTVALLFDEYNLDSLEPMLNDLLAQDLETIQVIILNKNTEKVRSILKDRANPIESFPDLDISVFTSNVESIEDIPALDLNSHVKHQTLFLLNPVTELPESMLRQQAHKLYQKKATHLSGALPPRTTSELVTDPTHLKGNQVPFMVMNMEQYVPGSNSSGWLWSTLSFLNSYLNPFYSSNFQTGLIKGVAELFIALGTMTELYEQAIHALFNGYPSSVVMDISKSQIVYLFQGFAPVALYELHNALLSLESYVRTSVDNADYYGGFDGLFSPF